MEQFNSFMSGSALNTLVGTGDRSTLMMVLQAQSAILAGGGDFTPTPSPLVAPPVQSAEEQASSLATAKGQVSASFSGVCTLKLMWHGVVLHTWLPLWRTQVLICTQTWVHIFSSFFYPFAGLQKKAWSRRLHSC